MSNFGDFRRALDGVVFGNPRRPSVARRNMAVKKHGGTFDTVEELIAYERAMGISVAAPHPRKAPAKKAAQPQAPAPRPARAAAPRAPFSGELRDPSGPPSYGQAKAIVISVGGLAQVCPGLVGQQVPGGAGVEGLKAMGLTKLAANRVIDAMKLQGVLYAKTAQQQAEARSILETVGGVSCPTPRRAASNPMFYGKKKLPAGSVPVRARVSVTHGSLYAFLDFQSASGSEDQLIAPFPSTTAGLKAARAWAGSFGVPVADTTSGLRGQEVRDRELARNAAKKKKAAAAKRAATMRAKKAAANPGRYQVRGWEQ